MARHRKTSASSAKTMTSTAAPLSGETQKFTAEPTISPAQAMKQASFEPETETQSTPRWQYVATPLLCAFICFSFMHLSSSAGPYTEIPFGSMRTFTEALNMHRNGQTHEAIAILREYVAAHPQDPEGYYELGLYERMVGRHESAANHNLRALELRNDFPEAYINLGVCQENLGNYSEARASYSALLNKRPTHFAALASLGSLSILEGKTDEAYDFFRLALQTRNDSGVRLRAALILPSVYSSFEEMQGRRDRVSQNIKQLSLSNNLALRHDALLDVNSVPFNLPYTGINNVVQMRMLYEAMVKADGSLLYSASHLATGRPVDLVSLPLSGNKIRVGVLSRRLTDSDVGKMVQGFTKYLPRDRIELFVILAPQTEDEMTQSIVANADHVVRLPYSLQMARQVVGDLKLHALLFPDCAAEPFSYYMAFSRLAPVQATTLVYPATTGLPTIDYFVSFKDIEPNSNQIYYTEKLVSLNGLGSRYIYAGPEGRLPSRSFYGIGEHEHVYFVPQEMHKLHPSFDQMMIAILRTDNNAKIAFVEPKFAQWQETFVQRLITADYAPADTKLRLVFFPNAPTRRFLNYYDLVDVVLDTYPMGGESCIREAISMGKPVVTLPTMAASGSFAKAYLNKIGTPELITSTVETYARTAVRLNTDSHFRARITKAINFNRFQLYNDQQSMEDWADFFVDAVKTVMPDLPYGTRLQ